MKRQLHWTLGFCIALPLIGVIMGCQTAGPAAQSLIDYTPETIPTGVSASVRDLRKITVVWDRPERKARLYRIERAKLQNGPFTELVTVPPALRKYVDQGSLDEPMADAATYFYRIIAILPSGQASQPSRAVMGSTAAEPDPPPRLDVAAPRSRAVRVRWQASASPEITRYRIERALVTKPTSFVRVAEVTETEYLDGGTVESQLTDSTDYIYRVTAINAVGAESKPAISEPVKTLPPPAAVQGLKAIGGEVRCVPLSWQPSPEPDVIRYEIYRHDSRSSRFEVIARTHGKAETSYLDGGGNPGNLADNETYSYRVRAVNSVMAESADSETATVTTHEVPKSTSNVEAESGLPRMVLVKWPVSQDKSVIGYEIWGAPKGGDFAQIARVSGAESSSFLYRGDTSDPAGLGMLADSAEYTFKVVEFNIGFVRSSASSPVTARTKAVPVPPSSLKASTATPRAITLSWTANPEQDIARYVVEVSDQQTTDFVKLADVPQAKETQVQLAHETGLGDGEIRYYRIKAVDKDRLESRWSGTVKGQTKAAPGPPLDLRVQKFPIGMRLLWRSPPRQDIREYVIWKKERFAWEMYGTTREQWFVFLQDELGKPITVKVSTIDDENLESAPTDPVLIEYQP